MKIKHFGDVIRFEQLWSCPSCKRQQLVDGEIERCIFPNAKKKNPVYDIRTKHIVCSNPYCGKVDLSIILYKLDIFSVRKSKKGEEDLEKNWLKVQEWRSVEELFRYSKPSKVPDFIWSEYKEALEIRGASPRCSGILARRCFRSIIHDVFSVSGENLLFEPTFSI